LLYGVTGAPELLIRMMSGITFTMSSVVAVESTKLLIQIGDGARTMIQFIAAGSCLSMIHVPSG